MRSSPLYYKTASTSPTSSRRYKLDRRHKANLLTMRMARRRQQNSVDIKATPTNVLVFLNVLMFLATSKFPYLRNRLMKINYRMAGGEYYRAFTSIFLHGSVSHLFMNCYSLLNIGPQADAIFGSSGYLSIYILSGAIANLGTFLANSSPFSLGASGCTFGLMGAFAAYFYSNKRILGAQSEQGLASIKRTLLMNVFYGASIRNIDNMAHLGGLLGGILLCMSCFGPKLSLRRNGAYGRKSLAIRRFSYARLLRLGQRRGSADEAGLRAGGSTREAIRSWRDNQRKKRNNDGEGNYIEYGDLSDDD